VRNRKAALRRLSVEQETVLSSWGNLLSGEPGESCLDTAVRLFGTAEAASDAWFGHRDALLAADPVPGRRPAGWWLFERRRDVPPVAAQAAILADLGELTPFESAQLAAWARVTPEIPADIALDRPSIVAIPEDPDAQAAARPTAAPPSVAGAIAPAPTEAADRSTRQKAQAAGELTPRELITEDHTDVDEPTYAAGGTGTRAVRPGHGGPPGEDPPEPRLDRTGTPGVAAAEHEHQDAVRAPGRPVHGPRRDDMRGVLWPLQPDLRAVQGWETEP
jgi:hypothetical protein